MVLIRFSTLIAVLLVAFSTFAQTTDQKAACGYLTNAARSQAVLLETPSALTGVTQSPIVNAPAQFVAGFSSSLAGIRKAHAVVNAAGTGCRLYSTTEDAAIKIQFLLPSLEREVLSHRVALDSEALTKMSELIRDNEARVTSGNATRQTLYSLETGRSKLFLDSSNTSTALSSLTIPALSNKPLYVLVAEKQAAEIVNQRALNDVNKTADFDLTSEVGLHHSIFSTGNTSAYGGFTFQYSPGKRKADRLADDSAREYQKWKTTQVSDVVQNSRMLHEVLVNGIRTAESSLASLQNQESIIIQNLDGIRDSETSAAIAFRTALESDRILLDVEIKDVEFRLSAYRTTLASEFGEDVAREQRIYERPFPPGSKWANAVTGGNENGR